MERLNCTLAKCLFGRQYAVEMLLPADQRWLIRLPDIVDALNNEVTSMTDKKPAVTIKQKDVVTKPSTSYSTAVGVNKEKLTSNVRVRYIHQPGELEGGTKRATDAIWSLKVYTPKRAVTKPNELVIYYLLHGPRLFR